MSLRVPIISINDDPDDQFIICQTLQELGVTNELRFFANGQEALSYLEFTQEQPFLILPLRRTGDINMPIMTGIELRQHIVASDYLLRKAIPFVFLTTAADAELVRQAYDVTVQGFYQKAADYTQFRQQIKLILDYWQSCLHPNNIARPLNR